MSHVRIANIKAASNGERLENRAESRCRRYSLPAFSAVLDANTLCFARLLSMLFVESAKDGQTAKHLEKQRTRFEECTV